ncbi:hypothetical protein BKA70DRAFT_1339103 [Coprinopsis sp. MPI-PUGE-AT-0042]|nr:hypothetical protein BKA70DRAFT_1339103 [Coprinopsis sp. MPI-PUGE-AT-0042]
MSPSPTVPRSTTNSVDTVPPEIWSKVVGSFASRKWHGPSPQSLCNFALVSKGWNEIARPFIFQTLELKIYTPNDLLAKQIALLHNILDSYPTIRCYFRYLIIRLDDRDGSQDYMRQWGGRILSLVERLSNISHFILDPDDGSIEAWLCLGQDYFFNILSTDAQQIFRQVCSLPSLERLDMRGIELPLSLFIQHPNLHHLAVSYGSNIIQDSQPTEVSAGSGGETPQLSSFSMVLHGAMDESEVLDFAPEKTLRTLLSLSPHLFDTLTSFDALTLAEEIEDIRSVLLATRNTLRHFACGLIWQRLHRPQFHPSNPPSPSQIEDEAKLDFSSMTQLRSVELRYDSPKKIGFAPTFPAILSTLRSIPWKQLEKLALIFAAVCPDDKDHEQWDYQEYTHQLDLLISPHVFVRGQRQGLCDIRFWIIKNCKRKCNERGLTTAYTPPTADTLFPILKERAHGREYIHVECRVEHNGWAPEYQACIIGGWKPVDGDDED